MSSGDLSSLFELLHAQLPDACAAARLPKEYKRKKMEKARALYRGREKGFVEFKVVITDRVLLAKRIKSIFVVRCSQQDTKFMGLAVHYTFQTLCGEDSWSSSAVPGGLIEAALQFDAAAVQLHRGCKIVRPGVSNTTLRCSPSFHGRPRYDSIQLYLRIAMRTTTLAS